MTDQNMQSLINELRELNRIHNELLKMISIIIEPEVKKRLNHIFSSPKELRAYRLTDGERTTREIGEMVDVSHTTIANWWKVWEEDYKIAKSRGTRSPYEALYSLPELVMLHGDIESEEG